MISAKSARNVQHGNSKRDIRFKISQAILKKSSQKAYDVLSSVGWDATKDPKSYVNADAIAKFYGVERKYLNSVFWRNGLIAGTHGVIKDPSDCKMRLYSANVVLAAAPLMCSGRSVPRGAKARSVYQVLSNTDYALEAKKLKQNRPSAKSKTITDSAAVPTDLFKNLFARFGAELAGAMTMALSSNIHTPASKQVNKRTSAN